jgi:hypothetical protein
LKPDGLLVERVIDTAIELEFDLVSGRPLSVHQFVVVVAGLVLEVNNGESINFLLKYQAKTLSSREVVAGVVLVLASRQD